MSKSLNTKTLLGGSAVGYAVMAMLAINFADRNVTPIPSTAASTVALQIPGGDAQDAVAPAGGLIAAANASTGGEGKYGIGRPALAEEIAAWDVDVLPDGRGLPAGSGNAIDGEEVFADYCASCHGDFAEGVDNWPVLAGGFGTLADEDPVKTVGSYWPYLSTVWDYVHRSMPFGGAGTLSDDETYAIVAYILYSNDLIEDDFELSRETFLDVEMPNADGFIIDDRAETEYALWTGEPCMENCKSEAPQITRRATDINVTPGQDHSKEAKEAAAAAQAEVQTAATTEATTTETAVEETAEATPVAAPAAGGINAELAAAGEKVYKKCKSCHQIGDGAKNKTGPMLTGIVGAPAGSVEKFKYSKPMQAAAEAGLVWTEEELKAFLAKPKDYMKGTKMSFAGLKKDADLDAIVEYLKAASQ